MIHSLMSSPIQTIPPLPYRIGHLLDPHPDPLRGVMGAKGFVGQHIHIQDDVVDNVPYFLELAPYYVILRCAS